MQTESFAALVFLPLVLPICAWVIWSDLSTMRIRNKSVVALVLVYVAVGPFLFPLQTYLWQLGAGLAVLVLGIVLNAGGVLGAGDAKFAAAAAPYIAADDAGFVIRLFAATLLGAVATHRLARGTRLQRLAPGWESWVSGRKFPMGLTLGATLGIYLIFKAIGYL